MFETIRYLFRELRAYQRTLWLLGTFSLVGALLELAGPLLMAKGIDAGTAHKGIWTIAVIVALWYANRSLSSWLALVIYQRGDNISQAVAGRHTQRLYERLIALPLSFHYGAEGQKMREQISSLRWKISNTISNSLFSVVPSILMLIALLLYIAWVDPLVSVILLVALVSFTVYTLGTSERVNARYEGWHKAWSAVAQAAGDALTNILVVKSTQSEEMVSRRVTEKREAFEALDRDVGNHDGTINQVQSAISGAGLACAMLFVIMRLQDGGVSVGVMTAVLAYAFGAFGQMRSIQFAYRALNQVHASRQVIEKELLPIVPEDQDAGTPITDIRGDVTFDHVAFRYREDRPILTDVSFVAKAGERIAIVGESGEGKSTIVDLIGRYYDRAGGVISVDGHDVRDATLRSLRGAMAYVPQDLTLLHDTLEENIRFGKPDATDAELQEATRLAQLGPFIDGLPEKMKTVVGERGLKLSGGERQRVALARAFLRKPRILILDEPTSNLDSKTETAVQASLRELMQGRTTFIIAHRLKTVQEMDRILVLKDGVIAEQGTHDELFAKKGAYYDLLRAQHLFIAPEEPHLGEESQAAQ